MSGARDEWVIGRGDQARVLADRLMYSQGGAFLITGFRGVGKTTFVHHALQQIHSRKAEYAANRGDFELLDVWITLSQSVEPGQLMHLIIRHLYLRLKESNLLSKLDPSLKEELEVAFLRTSFEISSKAIEGHESSRRSEFGYQPVKWLGLDFFGKLEASQTTKKSKENALQYLPYDDRAAEFDISKFARRLSSVISKPHGGWARFLRSLLRVPAPNLPSKSIKVIFVFDELDKLKGSGSEASNGFDSLLESLKVVFTSNEFSFVFIAGKEVHQRWIEDVALGDSVYESIFAYDFYVPCLWSEQEQFVHSCMSDAMEKPYQIHSPSWQLTQYLQYRGRGILRRMLRELNKCVAWDQDRPKIRIPAQNRGMIVVCSKLQEIVTEHLESFGRIADKMDEARSDRWRLGLYYTLDWILGTRGESFTVEDVRAAAASLKLGLAQSRSTPDDHVGRIIQVLSGRGFIEIVANNVTVIEPSKINSERYRLSEWVVLAIEQAGPAANSDAAAPPVSPADAQPQQSQIGKYRVESLIGKGGTASVYRCLTREGHPCAVKIISKEQGQSFGEQLVNHEVEILSVLHHPNVVRLVDHGIEKDQPFLVLELVEGESLHAVLARVRKCNQYVAIRLVRLIAETLAYVHEQKVIANDVKPGNVILTPRGSIKLIDFGTSLIVGKTPNASKEAGRLVGTIRYISPERLSGNAATYQADIFSLGIVLYELITGQSPFEGSTPSDILKNILESIPIPPSRLAPVTPEVDEIISRALAKDLNGRYSSMALFAASLKRLEQPVDLSELFQRAENMGQEVANVRMDFTTESIAPPNLARSSISVQDATSATSVSPQPYSGSANERIKLILQLTEDSGHAAVPRLRELVHDDDMKVRLTAFWELARLNRENDFDLLFDFVLDVCFFTNEEQAKVSLRKQRLTLGRLRDSDLLLQQPRVSRSHLMFFIQDGLVAVEVIGKDVTVNGIAVSRTDLKDGDLLMIASVRIKIHIHRPATIGHGLDLVAGVERSPEEPRSDPR